MFKWHMQSAVSRSRPIANDLKIVSDGIAASLRQFHISASRSDNEQPVPRTLRILRTSAATDELSSLQPSRTRAIDARSRAATPPPALRITRKQADNPPRFNNNGRGSSAPRGIRDSTPRGPAGFVPRGRGGLGGRGRGRGRGGATARGRGGGRGKGKRGGRKQRYSDAVDAADEPLSAEEIEYANDRDMGSQRPANSGMTTPAILESEIPGLATSSAPLGLVDTIRDHLKKLTGHHGNELLSAQHHARQYNNGEGTLFVNEEDKANVLGPQYYPGTPKEYKTIGDKERDSILKWLVAGQYPNMTPAMANDILGAVEAKANMNSTYLPKDTASLKAKVQELLPASKARKGGPKRASAHA